MRRRLVAVLALVALLFGAASYAIAETSGPQPVACTIAGGTLSCPVPQATVTETATADPVTVFSTATSTVIPPAVTKPAATVTVTKTATRTTTRTVTATSSPRSSTATPTPTQPPVQAPTTSSTPTAPASSGAYPDATNTGVPAGTALTARGSIASTTAGQVIQNVDVAGCINVTSDNVTIRNVRIKGTCNFLIENDSNSGLVLSDVEIDGLNTRTATGIGGSHWTATRLNVHGTGDGLKLGEQTSIVDSYVHDLVGISEDHNDGMQLSDGHHVLVRHNTILIGLKSATSAILAKADFGPIDDLVIDNNFVGGGAWTIYAGNEAGNCSCGPATNVSVTNNTFSTAYWAKSGAFGPLTDTLSSYVVSGNRFDNGSPVS